MVGRLVVIVLAALLMVGVLRQRGGGYLPASQWDAASPPHRVQYVVDGDTLQLQQVPHRIRLWGVDAAELDTRGGEQAQAALQRLVSGQPLTYVETDRDRYGRIVARLFLADGQEVNSLLIAQGVAREYCYFSHNFYGHCSQ